MSRKFILSKGLHIRPQMIFIIVAILLLLLGIFKTSSINTRTDSVYEKISSAIPTANSFISSDEKIEVPGTVTWNTIPEEIQPTGALKLFTELTYGKLYANFLMSAPTFYKIGVWKTGEYANNDIIDVELESGIDSNSIDIIRVTRKDDTIVLFPTSSLVRSISANAYLKQQDPYYTAHPFDNPYVLIDLRLIPDLIPPYHGDYQTKLLGNNSGIFSLHPNTDFFERHDYKFLTTFPHGQKLYAVNQMQIEIPWNNLENPYLTTELDNLIYWTTEKRDFLDRTSVPTAMHWLQQPDLLTDLYNSTTPNVSFKTTSLDNIVYSTSFTFKCTDIPLSLYTKNVVFSPKQATLIATQGNNSFYLPSRIDTLQKGMFNELQNQVGTPPFYLSFERFINSFPVIVWKDTFGIYQALYRIDYPWQTGCGH